LEAPKDVAELKKLIVSRSKEFPESLKRILELSFTRPEAIAFSNVSSLAACCRIAPSSVKALGYRSFGDFRQIYRDHILTQSRRVSSAPPGGVG
jgi:DNA-binding MurR/RpiR family transcriptional regulator